MRCSTFLAARAVPGTESVERATYRRSLRLAKGNGVVSVAVAGGTVSVLARARRRGRRAGRGATHPAAARPGQRPDAHRRAPRRATRCWRHSSRSGPGCARRRTPTAPNCSCGPCSASRSAWPARARWRAVSSPRTVSRSRNPVGASRTRSPSAATIAGLRPEDFAMPRARGAALIEACAHVADGRIVLDAGSDRTRTPQRRCRRCRASARGLPATWRCVRSATRTCSCPPTSACATRSSRSVSTASPRSAAALAERWSPWRSYALHHLWASSVKEIDDGTH